MQEKRMKAMDEKSPKTKDERRKEKIKQETIDCLRKVWPIDTKRTNNVSYIIYLIENDHS